MMKKNNNVALVGVITSPLKESCTKYGETIYEFTVDSVRKSGAVDEVVCRLSHRIVSEEVLHKLLTDGVGLSVKMFGRYASHNLYDEVEKRKKLFLSVFVDEFSILDKGSEEDTNKIHLDGFICKKPVLRTTKHDKKICDVFIAVNRSFDRADYIPCIFWGKNAMYVSEQEVGTEIWLDGRLQSRKYEKRMESGEYETRTAYEVSVYSFAPVKNDSAEDGESNDAGDGANDDAEGNA